jgi:hypothetical protein
VVTGLLSLSIVRRCAVRLDGQLAQFVRRAMSVPLGAVARGRSASPSRRTGLRPQYDQQ